MFSEVGAAWLVSEAMAGVVAGRSRSYSPCFQSSRMRRTVVEDDLKVRSLQVSLSVLQSGDDGTRRPASALELINS